MISDAVILIIAVFGLLLLILACQRLFRTRLLAAGGAALTGSLLLAVAALLFVVSLNLHTYARLTNERPVAEIVFEQRAQQTFNATLTQVPNGEIQMFVLAGDEWQLDARVLKWKGWANLFGLDAQYRLERVSGRYRNIDQERTAERTVYALAENPGLDLWQLTLDKPDRLPFVDAVYGNAAYMPMSDGARYEVSITQTGLIARPVNAAAQQAAGSWK
ncbi:MAG: cation/multidrug efflux pump [Pseudomonadota bacterium]|nr:cation/multidrug efflux pump [Pseudomonadota bacterium]